MIPTESQAVATRDDIIESPSSAPNHLPEKVTAAPLVCSPDPSPLSRPMSCPAIRIITGSGRALPGRHGLSDLQLSLEKQVVAGSRADLLRVFWLWKGWVVVSLPPTPHPLQQTETHRLLPKKTSKHGQTETPMKKWAKPWGLSHWWCSVR